MFVFVFVAGGGGGGGADVTSRKLAYLSVERLWVTQGPASALCTFPRTCARMSCHAIPVAVTSRHTVAVDTDKSRSSLRAEGNAFRSRPFDWLHSKSIQLLRDSRDSR